MSWRLRFLISPLPSSLSSNPSSLTSSSLSSLNLLRSFSSLSSTQQQSLLSNSTRSTSLTSSTRFSSFRPHYRSSFPLRLASSSSNEGGEDKPTTEQQQQATKNDEETDFDSDLDSLFEKDPEFLKERRAEENALKKRVVLKKYFQDEREALENATDSENEELLQFANYEDDYDDLEDMGDFSDQLNLSRAERDDLGRTLGEFGSLSEADAGSDASDLDAELIKLMDGLSASDEDLDPVYKTDTEEGEKIEFNKPFDQYTSKNPQGLFTEEDFHRELALSSASDSDESGVEKAEGSEERAMEELFGETDDDAREDQEDDYDYDEPSLYDEGEEDMDAVHERDLTNLSGKDGVPHPSRMDLESDIVERLTEPSEEMIERENAAAQIPSRLQSGEPEIPLSQKYDVEKWGRYLDLPEAPKIEPIHWDDVVAAFKEKGEEHKLEDVRHAWDAITTACHVHFTQSGTKNWDWGYLRRSVFSAAKPTVHPKKELGFLDEEAEPVVRVRNRATPVAMAEPVAPITPVSKLLKLPGLPKARESEITHDGSTRAGGRRKTATAHVRLSPGTGRIVINKTCMTEYFDKLVCREMVMQPFYLTERLCEYDVYAKTRGGGIFSQAEAIRLAISRALQKQNPSHRLVLKRAKLLKRDPRMVERKKPGQAKAHKKNQWSKR